MTFVHRCKWNVPTGRCFNCILTLTTGADPRFQVKRGVLKKIAPSGGGGTKIFGVFRVKNHDFMPKNHIFSNFRGGVHRVCPPGPWKYYRVWSVHEMKLPNCQVFAKFEKMLICTVCASYPSTSGCHNQQWMEINKPTCSVSLLDRMCT